MSSANNVEEIDQGKFRTLLTEVLKKAASKEGHTLLSYGSAIARIFKSELTQENYFQAKDIDNYSEFLEQGDLYINKESSYIKLKKYQRYKEYIESVVSSRLRGSIQARQNWMKVIDELYGDIHTRREIFNALKILETSK
ncbi:MAG: hypothetical protein GX777_07385, partial [Fastidiosipila sp.]|nr:hypothetical protein [Fastidiosipila sp.]